MKFPYSLILILLIIGLWTQTLNAQDLTNASGYTKIGTGARAIGLGGAFVAVADDASAGYWNPAGMTQLPGFTISLADRLTDIETDYANIALAFPVWKLGFLGINAIYYSCGDVTTYDNYGASTGILTDEEVSLILSYAYRLNQLSVGINGKYFYQNMEDDYQSDGADGTGIDIAILYRVFKKLKVGAIFHSKYQMTDSSSGVISGKTPINIRAGICYRTDMDKNSYLNIMFDLDQTRFHPLKLNVGTELVIYDIFTLRTGLGNIYAETKDSGIPISDLIKENLKPTFGLGIKWKMGKRETSPGSKQSAIIFDYALSIERLGLRNFFTLGYQF